MEYDHYADDVRLDVLGPLRAEADGQELALGGRQQRLVLALLIRADGATLQTERLIDLAWDGDPPASARKTLQGYVHHLRTTVGSVITTSPGGYALQGAEIDADLFAHAHRRAKELIDVDSARAAELLRDALELWHGPAYADLRDNAAIAEAARALDEKRVYALSDRVEADLHAGRHNALVSELHSLVAEYPFHERFRGQLMLALYRAGRQVEALRAYEQHRTTLLEELGLEPSADLRDLEQRILRHDESLMLAAGAHVTAHSVRGYELREQLGDDGEVTRYRAYQRSIGRDVMLTRFGPSIADDPDVISGFDRAAQQVGALEHPHLVPVLDTWREPGCAYQVTSWLGGGSLADASPANTMSMGSALRLLRQVGSGLDAARRSGVRHGALGPDTVWLDRDGNAYLGGFPLRLRDDPDVVADDDRSFAALAAAVLPDDRPELHDLLAEAAAGQGVAPLQLVRALESRAGLAAEVEPASGRRSRRNPYKGLAAFTEGDRGDFHGREDLVARLVDIAARHRLIAVVGASGSGKSSVVRAGLLPALRARPRRTMVAEMFPGAYPFEELETALRRISTRDQPPVGLTEDARGLLRAAKQIRPDDNTEIVLLVDQFEELYTMTAEESDRELFLDSLVAAASEARSPLRIVITLRADFFDRPLSHPTLAPLVREGLVPVSVPENDELARAIAGPATAVGVTFEDGLVPQIVADLGRHPGVLPLLQHALTELFEGRSADVITLADYQRSGGVLGAVGRRAEALHEELTPAARHALRQIMLRLVTVEGASGDLRRRLRRSELRGLDLDPGAVEVALQSFARHRLLTFDRDEASRGATVEIAHEALLREWPRLAGWVEEHREDLRTRNRLSVAVEEWTTAGEDPAYLVRGSRLSGFDDWARSTALAISQTEHVYLQRSVEAEADRVKAVAQRRRRTLMSLVAAVVLLTVVASFALVQRRTAEDVAFDAETARLAATAESLADTNPTVAMLLAVAAHQREESPSTLGALQVALVNAAPLLGTLGPQTTYVDVEWLSNGLVAGVREDGIDLYDPNTGELLDTASVPVGTGQVPIAGLGSEWRSRAAADVPLLIVGATDGRVRVYDVGARGLDPVEELDAGGDVATVAAAEDGTWFAAGTLDTQLVLWDASGREVHREDLSDAPNVLVHLGDDAPPGVEVVGFIYADSQVVPGLEFFDGELHATVAGTVHRYDRDGARVATYQQVATLAPDIQLISYGSKLRRTDRGIVAYLNYAGVADEGAFADGGVVEIGIVEGTFGGGSPNPQPGTFAAGLFWTALTDGTVIGVDPSSGERRADTGLRVVGPQSMVTSPDQTRLALATAQGLVLLSPLESGPISHGIPRHPVQTSPSVARDGTHVAIGPPAIPGPLDLLAVDGVTSGAVLTRRLDLDPGEGIGMSISPGTRNDLQTFVDGVERHYSLTSGTPELTVEAPQPGGNFRIVAPDRSYQVTVGSEFNVHALPSNELIRGLGQPPGSPTMTAMTGAAFHPDGQRVLVSAPHGRSQLYDTESWELLEDDLLAQHDIAVGRWNDDGTLLATASADGRISLRDGESFEIISTMLGSTGTSNTWAEGTLLLLDDDQMLLTNFDGPGRLWDVATGQQIGDPFPTAPSTNTATHFGDNPQLVTTGERTAQLWNLDLDTWPDIACRTVATNLTAEEWDQWGPRDTGYDAICQNNPLPG